MAIVSRPKIFWWSCWRWDSSSSFEGVAKKVVVAIVTVPIVVGNIDLDCTVVVRVFLYLNWFSAS